MTLRGKKRQRHVTLPFLKIDMRHWGPPVKGPSSQISEQGGGGTLGGGGGGGEGRGCRECVWGGGGEGVHAPPLVLREDALSEPLPVFWARFKPIFHQNAKYLASGVGVGQAPNARILRYPTQNIPTFWYILC